MDWANFINPKNRSRRNISNRVEINIAVAKRKISRRHYSKIQSYRKNKCLLTGVLFACQRLLEIISLFIYLISSLCRIMFFFLSYPWHVFFNRGAEWYLEKRGSRKILAGSRNLGSVFDKSRSLVFSWFVFTFLSLENFHQRVSGSDF